MLEIYFILVTSSAQGLLLCSFVLSDAQDRATQVAECFVLDTARGPSQVVTGGPQGSFDEDGRGFAVHLCGSHWLKQSRSDKALLVSVKRFLVLMSKNVVLKVTLNPVPAQQGVMFTQGHILKKLYQEVVNVYFLCLKLLIKLCIVYVKHLALCGHRMS